MNKANIRYSRTPRGRRGKGREEGSEGTRTSLVARVGTPREGSTWFLGPGEPRYHFLAATQDLAEERERLANVGGIMRRDLGLEECGEGIQSLDFLLEATGQEVRVEAER